MTDPLALALASVDERLAKARAKRAAAVKHRGVEFKHSERRLFSADDEHNIRALAAQGLSSSEIGERVGRSPSTVRRLCRNKNITLTVGNRTFDYAEAERLYLAGDTVTRIARKMGVGPSAIDNALSRLGTPRRPRSATWFQPSRKRAEIHGGVE